MSDITTETRNSLYGLNHLTLALLEERSNDEKRLVQVRIGHGGLSTENTATIELSEMKLMLDRLFDAVERDENGEYVDVDIDDVLGIWPNMTGGKSIEEYKDSLWEEG